MNSNTTNASSENTSSFTDIQFKIFGDYLLTREILNSIDDGPISEEEDQYQMISPTEFIHQHKIMHLIKSFPSFIINKDYLHNINSRDKENKQCAICMEEYQVQNVIKTLPCFHLFHEKCIDEWLDNSYNCPICKFEIDVEQ